MEAFQMLCPGCVSHGLPQAKRIQHTFGDAVTVLGLHCVFEHHAAMTPSHSKHSFTSTASPSRSASTPTTTGPPFPSRWADTSCEAPRAWWSSTGPDTSASTRSARSTTLSSALLSPASSTNRSQRPTATPTWDVPPPFRHSPRPGVRTVPPFGWEGTGIFWPCGWR